MLGIDRQSEFGTFVTRRVPQDNPVIDNVNAADVFNSVALENVYGGEINVEVTPEDIKDGMSLFNWSSSFTFFAANYRIVEWTSGDITLADGTVYNITAGNTGNMSDLTYIYLDTAVSETGLQITTSSTQAVGMNKILVGVAQNNTDTDSKATFQVFGGSGGMMVPFDSIAANKASTNELITNTAQMANAIIDTGHIRNGAIDNAKIQNGTIRNAKIADATIDMAKIKSVNADTITAGTLTGRTVKASGGSQDVWLTNDGVIRWRRGGVERCYIYAESDGSMLTHADTSYYVNTHRYFLNASGNITLAGDDIIVGYDDDNNGKDCYFKSQNGNLLTAKITTTGKIKAHSTIEENAIDFAEYFENLKKGVITGGTTVVMEKGKVRKAKKGEVPFGVVTLTPAFVGNTGAEDVGDAWHGKYLRDEDMQYVMEEVDFVTYLVKSDKYAKKPNRKIHLFADQKPPKGAVEIARKKDKRRVINPDYDEKRKFIPREDRPEEWSLIGLLGQCLIKKGQPVAPQWIKMKDFNHKYDFYLVR